jgi:hypothetical protein
MGKAAIILAMLALAGCPANGNQPTGPGPKQVWCDQNSPRRPTQATVNVMSRAELDDLNIYNTKGALCCGWTP